ncbi:aminotransferase class III-fold pyridoxal phosphate-dependent enzyme [bacterium]|nr:aminotransferase class III-fold pyridoxal phosphate-dependent enzyme [bacterium]
MGKGQDLYKKAKTLIPGGTQLLSKRPEMFLPDHWPSYYSMAQGINVWDLDGNKFIDMSIMGVGACILGYADPDVDATVYKAIANGSMCTLNCPEEVELAELLCELHPWADMARYARTGGEAAAMAIRIARAATGRDTVAICGYHGWHDWYLAANLGDISTLDGHLLPGLAPAGVPRALKGTALTFNYGDKEAFKTIVDTHGSSLAAIIMEPARGHDAPLDFLKYIRSETSRVGAVFVFDEITSGFRMCCGGIHLKYGIYPDIAIFAKSMSNGYPMAAILGKRAVMESAQNSFISSTYWTERTGPAAAIATIQKYRDRKVDEHIIYIGKQLQNLWQEAADEAGLPIHVSGLPTLGHFDIKGDDPLMLRTLFTQLMLERGYLAWCQFKVSYAHKQEHIDAYKSACYEVFKIIHDAIRQGLSRGMLKGPVSHSGFKRLVD